MRTEILSIIIGIGIFITCIVGVFSGENEVVFLLEAQKQTIGQLFWSTEGQDFSEKMSVEFYIHEGIPQTYRVRIPEDLYKINSIRIDPGAVIDNNVVISYMLMKRPGYRPFSLNLSNLLPGRGAKIKEISNKLNLVTTSDSPILIIDVNSITQGIDWSLICFYLAISLLLTAFIWSLKFILRKPEFGYLSLTVTICLAVVFSLSLSMATTAGFNASPDERDHFMAAEYYKTNSIIPQKGSELGLYTYNGLWAYSRVYQLGYHYFMAGKFSNFFDAVITSYKSVRFFGVFLILFLILFSLLFPQHAILLAPFLMTPQAWYIFSYVNDDYFPLFTSFILVVITERCRGIILTPKLSTIKVLVVGLTATLLGMLFLAKENYWVFIATYILYLLSLPFDFGRGFRDFIGFSKAKMVTPVAILILSLSIFSMRVVLSQLNDEKLELSERSASFFKQSEGNLEKHLEVGRSGEARWGSYFKMMVHWIPASYKSSNGVYGYFKFFSSEGYFTILKVIHLILVLSVLTWMILRPTPELLWLALISIGALAGLIFASSYLLSFVYVYQPQGKYLLPFLPVLSIFFTGLKGINNKYYLGPVILLTILGIYSFVFFGLNNL